MKTRIQRSLSLALLLCGVAASEAQTASPPPVAGVAGMAGQARIFPQQQGPVGSVAGRIVFGDTQAPARFAQVVLIPVAAVDTDNRPGGGFRGVGMGGNGRTDLDGNFTIANVAAGDYYVAGQATGYVSETSLLQARAADGADAQALLASLPQVRVTAGTVATANVSLTRGGVISGHVQWDDGSPATGVAVSAVVVTVGTSSTAGINQGNSQGAARGGFGGGFGPGGFGATALTDDRGVFRITGLAPGTYTLRATVQAPMGGNSGSFFQRTQQLTLYAPGKVRKADAQSFLLHTGEERDDVQFVLDLRSLHTVTGHVGAASGPQPESGTVRVTDSSDTSLNRSAVIAADGTFALTYVPSGSYTLSVSGASTTPQTGNGGGRRGGSGDSTAGIGFQAFSESLAVTDTDVSGVAVNLTPASPSTTPTR